MKEVISVLNFAVLPERKYLLRKALERTSHMVSELGSLFYNQSLTLSLNENRKSLMRIASTGIPFNLIVSHFARKLRRCMLGFSEGCPPNWSFSTKEIRMGGARSYVPQSLGSLWKT